jgi:hypothetical protein
LQFISNVVRDLSTYQPGGSNLAASRGQVRNQSMLSCHREVEAAAGRWRSKELTAEMAGRGCGWQYLEVGMPSPSLR